ncbi:MAG: tRNA 5-methoxyuridine(34)/uridine 5-oxyacetic acid(34) synthase CmoB [Chromatiales bacterium]
MTDCDALARAETEGPLGAWTARLRGDLERTWRQRPHGDLPAWLEAVSRLPDVVPSQIDLGAGCVTAGLPGDVDEDVRRSIEAGLRRLHPWRKGPYCIHGVHVDTEWRSDWKWARIATHIRPLQGRRVLDVGCGNGYHCWRMAGEGARLAVGIDPTQLFVAQFYAVRHFLDPGLRPLPLALSGCAEAEAQERRERAHLPVFVLPLALEDLPSDLQGFDTAFSLGVLYHRRSPFEHLARLRGALRPGGELVLETLVVEGADGKVLVPEGRYARMRNVWFIPSPPTLEAWLRRAGFADVRCVDITPTTTDEQRPTDWMRFESLARALDPCDPSRTVEGHPAPLRGLFVAEKPQDPNKAGEESPAGHPAS